MKNPPPVPPGGGGKDRSRIRSSARPKPLSDEKPSATRKPRKVTRTTPRVPVPANQTSPPTRLRRVNGVRKETPSVPPVITLASEPATTASAKGFLGKVKDFFQEIFMIVRHIHTRPDVESTPLFKLEEQHIRVTHLARTLISHYRLEGDSDVGALRYVPLTPRQLGFIQAPHLTDVLDPGLLEEWSSSHLDCGYTLDLCPSQAGPYVHLDEHYPEELKNQGFLIAMEPIYDLKSEMVVFGVDCFPDERLLVTVSVKDSVTCPLDRHLLFIIKKIR